jgi:hypothetical protein
MTAAITLLLLYWFIASLIVFGLLLDFTSKINTIIIYYILSLCLGWIILPMKIGTILSKFKK